MAGHDWSALSEIAEEIYFPEDPDAIVNHYAISQCTVCGEMAFWRKARMIYPMNGGAPPPHADMPQDVRSDYLETMSIAGVSPRGASALLRLSIQKLCKELGESGENINADIAELVKKGLDQRIQRALDIVRVVGNNAVHPGRLDIRDNPRLAQSLFALVNEIVEERISKDRRLDELYSELPEGARKQIESRDKVHADS